MCTRHLQGPYLEEKKEKPKKVIPKKEEKAKIIKKISKSILSKVKSLTTQKANK